MIRRAHQILVSNAVTRKWQRRLVQRLKAWLSVPDAYGDLASLIQRTSPDSVLDIGSHHGHTIARLLESCSVPIHGFEPASETFERLSQRYAGHPLVSVHQIALSSDNGTAVLHLNRNEQTNSLLDNDQFNTQAFGEHCRHVGSEKIATARLDDWMAHHLPEKNVIIKSDIQGAEELLLAGGRKTFATRVIGFYSEAQIAPMYDGQIDFFSLHRILTDELDFVLHNIYPCLHDRHGRALQTDALWIKNRYLHA